MKDYWDGGFKYVHPKNGDDDDSNDSDFRCLNHQGVVEPVGEVDIFLQLSLESSIETVDIQNLFLLDHKPVSIPLGIS